MSEDYIPRESDTTPYAPSSTSRHKAKSSKYRGAATYSTKCEYNLVTSWTKKYECTCASCRGNDAFSFYCTVYRKKMGCRHQREFNIKRRVSGAVHVYFARQLETQPRVAVTDNDPVKTKVCFSLISQFPMNVILRFTCIQFIRAEVKLSTLLAQHNLPLALADHLSPMVRDAF